MNVGFNASKKCLNLLRNQFKLKDFASTVRTSTIDVKDTKVAFNTTKLTEKQITTLERISGLKFTNQKEVWSLEQDITLANQVFKVDTTNVEPLFSITEESINCPLREDIPVTTDSKKIFMNTKNSMEGFFVSSAVQRKQEE
ncbi:unnamed protein product [Bursaphelenchus okinawaensis]|uniref:Glu-AdT subunit C n=1 Tax=Bursaphelenchus okinawaensis TaxID=465554 RepID=A0A811JTV9_9BILA|nr:unnamed protein product [Bursaphelenchus okinawaensis]CAG9083200.1 unnamed protein product [Bursaphelenchus okinawaensis]